MKNKLCILVCQHYRREAEEILKSEEWDDVKIITYSAQCGVPNTSVKYLDPALNTCEKDDVVFVLSGSCISHQEKIFLMRPGISNVKHIQFSKQHQCSSMFLGHEIIEDLTGKGFYLVTPGWLSTWKQKIESWGFNSKEKTPELINFFKESAQCIFLLDTGVDEKSNKLLLEFAEFVDRPFDSLYAGLDFFRLILSKVVLEWRIETIKKNNTSSDNAAVKKVADYSMVVELLSRMTKISSERDVIYGIRDLFSMLFAPGNLRCAVFRDNTFSEIYSDETGWSPVPPEKNNSNNSWIEFTGDFSRIESGHGFKIRISYSGETLIILEADEIGLPEHIEQYLSLALSIANVCGLAISNARYFNQIQSDKDKINSLLTKKKTAP